jgi:hypothetical protein
MIEKRKPQFKNLNVDKLSVNEAVYFTSDFLDQLIDFVTDCDFSEDDELNELKSYVYATRMYYLKTLQIIEKEKRKVKEQENLNAE